jgi:hypothetical protein
MQQRQLRLGDILDDYCPRERRVTNHAVVAMLGEDVKQTRCTTCDAEHEYKHAKVPRQRRKNETPAALYSQVLAGAPKRVAHGEPGSHADADGNGHDEETVEETAEIEAAPAGQPVEQVVEEPSGGVADVLAAPDEEVEDEDDQRGNQMDEGPVHRPLIRAALPRPEGHVPPARPIPEFTIRQPTGRQNRFRPRHQGGGQGQQRGGFGFQGGGGNRNGNGNFGGPPRGGRPGGGGSGRPQHGSGMPRHQGPRKRSK